MKSVSKKIIDDLCCRNTKVRFGVINIFHQTKKPLSVSEIIDLLEKDYSTTANKTTIYRQLEFLESKKMLSSIEIDGSKYFQLNKTQSHQMLICTECHNLIPLENSDFPSNKQIDIISQQSNFKINRYSFLYFGSCQNCQ